ncbi:MAG: hypothetical protein ACFFAQ_12710 [Promethearchaeota archaeon]
MIDREKISPLLIIGIGLIILSIFGVIFFTLPLLKKKGAGYFMGPLPWIPFIGIFIGGILLFLGIYFNLPSNRSKGIFLICMGSFLLIFELYAIIPIIIATYPYFIGEIYPIIPEVIVTLVLIGKGIQQILTTVQLSKNKRKYIRLMTERKKLSPLLFIGIGLVILSVFGVIFFTLPLVKKKGAGYFIGPRPWIPVIGIFIGGMLFFIGMYFSLASNRSKGIFLISIGSFLLIFIIYFIIFILIQTPPYPSGIIVIIIPEVIVTLVLIGKGIDHISIYYENNWKTTTQKKYSKQIFETNPDCQHCALARNLGLKECPYCGKKLIK